MGKKDEYELFTDKWLGHGITFCINPNKKFVTTGVIEVSIDGAGDMICTVELNQGTKELPLWFKISGTPEAFAASLKGGK